MISQILSHVYVVIIWLTRRKNINQNISYQHYISSYTKLVLLNIQRLAWCTTQLLAIMDLNVHLNVSRIWKILGSINDNMFDISLIIVIVVRKWTCWKFQSMLMDLQPRHIGVFEYRFHRSISGPRIYPCNSRYFHSMGRIVSYYWCDSFICCRVSAQTLRSF